MKIGLVSDIHSNIVSFEKVLQDMPEVDKMICVGDIVGYGPNPVKCLEKVRDKCDFVVQGNHDRVVSSSYNFGGNSMAQAGVNYSKKMLSEKQREWLGNLNPVGQYQGYLVAHSHPTIIDKYVYPREFSKVSKKVAKKDLDGLILGHTHIQAHEKFDKDSDDALLESVESKSSSKDINSILVANPGSVGQPRDKKPTAAYGILDTEKNSVKLKRVSYDITEVRRRIQQASLPKRTGERLTEGR